MLAHRAGVQSEQDGGHEFGRKQEPALQAQGVKFVRVDGGTKISERQTMVDSFQKENSGVDLIISSLKDRLRQLWRQSGSVCVWA